MATYSVTSLGSGGAGSLRQAILDANASPGADTIDFAVSGTIRVGRSSLPAITDKLAIDGASAPSFAGSPVVAVDYHGTKGLRFARGADGSALRSLSLVNAANAGVTLDASRVTIAGNFIGLRADGRTVSANRGDGIRINASSHGNLIGREDPVTGVDFFNANAVGLQPVSAWQGIRDSDKPGSYLIVGTSAANGLLYMGSRSATGPAASPRSTRSPASSPLGRPRRIAAMASGSRLPAATI